jgi:hypothetical protein
VVEVTAELLREAAALMRTRAETASGGPWSADEDDTSAFNEWAIWSPSAGHDFALVETGHDAEHIASWHPAVALAVADWLDEVHADLSTYNATTTRAKHAFAVARAYLGTAS